MNEPGETRQRLSALHLTCTYKAAIPNAACRKPSTLFGGDRAALLPNQIELDFDLQRMQVSASNPRRWRQESPSSEISPLIISLTVALTTGKPSAIHRLYTPSYSGNPTIKPFKRKERYGSLFFDLLRRKRGARRLRKSSGQACSEQPHQLW